MYEKKTPDFCSKQKSVFKRFFQKNIANQLEKVKLMQLIYIRTLFGNCFLLQHFHLSHYNTLYIKYYSSLIIYDDQLLVFDKKPTIG